MKKSNASFPLGLGSQELAPGGAATARSRAEAVRPKERADLRGGDPDPEFGELAPDPEAAPPGVLPPHPKDQLSNLVADRGPAARGGPPEAPLPPNQLPVPAKQRLRADHERRPPNSRKGPAHRGHENTVATAKTGPPGLALQDLQLVAKDDYLDVAVQMIGGASDKLDQSAQQQAHEREEHGRNLPRG